MTNSAAVVAVSAVTFDREDRVLVIERGRPPGEGLWSLPGGKLIAGETLAQAVAREVREETGMIVEVGGLVTVVERITDHAHYVIVSYAARPIGGSLAAGDDARAARFIAERDLSRLAVTDGLLDVIARCRAMHGPWFTSRSPMRPSGAR